MLQNSEFWSLTQKNLWLFGVTYISMAFKIHTHMLRHEPFKTHTRTQSLDIHVPHYSIVQVGLLGVVYLLYIHVFVIYIRRVQKLCVYIFNIYFEEKPVKTGERRSVKQSSITTRLLLHNVSQLLKRAS